MKHKRFNKNSTFSGLCYPTDSFFDLSIVLIQIFEFDFYEKPYRSGIVKYISDHCMDIIQNNRKYNWFWNLSCHNSKIIKNFIEVCLNFIHSLNLIIFLAFIYCRFYWNSFWNEKLIHSQNTLVKISYESEKSKQKSVQPIQNVTIKIQNHIRSLLS